VARLENLLHRHGYGPSRHLIETIKPAFAYLLAATGFVKLHDKIWFVSFKVRGRIVKRQVSIFSNTNERPIDGLARNQFSHATALFLRVRVLTVDEVKSAGVHAVNDPLSQVPSETRAMRVRQTNVLVEVKESSPGPIDVPMLSKGIEKLEL
jgi:hypothetical protein